MKHVFDTPVQRADTHSVKWEKYRGTQVIPMWVADMDLPVSIPIQEAIQRRAGHSIYGYTAPSADLVATVCEMLARQYGWVIDPQWIVWLPGTLPGVAAGCRAFSEPGDQIAFNIPAFSEFYRVVRRAGREALTIPMIQTGAKRWTFDFERLREAITPRTRVLLLCSPNNPTGTLFTAAELNKLSRICAEKGVVILSDEVHSGLVLAPGKRHVPTACACPEAAEQMVTLMSPSKTYNLGGVNCAYAIIQNEGLRQRFIMECEAFGMMPTASTFPYAAALAAYRDSNAWHGAALEYLWANYEYLDQRIQGIHGIELSPLEATYLAWLDVSALNLDNATAYFEQHGVGLSAGEGFGNGSFVRMNFACPRSTLVTAIDRIEQAVACISKTPCASL